MNVHASLEPGKTVTVEFDATEEGVFPYYCTEFCSALHLEMMGYLMVKDPQQTICGCRCQGNEADA